MPNSQFVVPGLDPGIHRKKKASLERMDCRGKPGSDEQGMDITPA
jgi:hypothetical protein